MVLMVPLQIVGIGDVESVHVHDVVAVVRNETRAVACRATEPDQRTLDQAPCHRNDLDRQRKRAQEVHRLAVVDDADKPLGSRGDDLLAG